MKPRTQRAMWIIGSVAAIAVAAGLILNALNSNIAFYVTPSEVADGKAPQARVFRVGGLVKPGSITRDHMTVRFAITDTVNEMAVTYTGILPDLFKEGKGAVVQGRLDAQGRFQASEVLAKHDENYMPPEAQLAIDQAKAPPQRDTVIRP